MFLMTEVPDLSKAEYDILRALWRNGSQSIREVHDTISPQNGWAYSTTKTTMDRMVKKGFLNREQFHGVYIYSAQISRPAGLVRLVQFFADKVLETDYGTVVSLFARNNTLREDEIAELNRLLEEDTAEDKKND